MRRFLLVRHATAEEGDDPGLGEAGRAEAAALARRLTEWRLDAVWSSDLRRARETASPILVDSDAPLLRLSPLLREVDFQWESSEQGYEAWEADTVAALAIDLSEWLDEVAAEVEERSGENCPNVLVVSHAGPLRVLICLLLGLPVDAHWSFRVDRASLSIVERVEDMGALTLLNDRCHLEI